MLLWYKDSDNTRRQQQCPEASQVPCKKQCHCPSNSWRPLLLCLSSTLIPSCLLKILCHHPEMTKPPPSLLPPTASASISFLLFILNLVDKRATTPSPLSTTIYYWHLLRSSPDSSLIILVCPSLFFIPIWHLLFHTKLQSVKLLITQTSL